MNACSPWKVSLILTALASAPVAATPLSAQENVAALLAEERPIEAANTVWIEEMTWMEVRDELATGTTTVLVPTGGIEQNGPYVATGKHNYVLSVACDRIARKLGNALCAPIIKLVPEGALDGSTGHMRFPGTISVRQETFRAMLEDVATSLHSHGFTDIVFIGDSGGNQTGMEQVAQLLNERWTDGARAHYIAAFYDNQAIEADLEREFGIVEGDDGWHDFFWLTAMQMLHDPATVRYEQRLTAGRAHINGVSIEDLERTLEIGERLTELRVDRTVDAIRSALESGR